MNRKQILIVDDDPDLLFLVAHGVKTLGLDYQVTTAADGFAAINKVQTQKFDLIVTDYMMPEMTGLELVEQVRQLSPETQCILMTAHHDTSGVRSEVEHLNLAGFVGKPFTMPEFMKVVEDVVAQIDTASNTETLKTPVPKESIQEHLKNLHRQIGARTVLLVSSDGSPKYVVGVDDRDRIIRLASFVSANFLAIVELASLFGDTDTVFTSSYYEGNNYNIYAYNINGDYFLAVLFDAGGKPGTVWFYTKQVATILASLLPSKKPTLTNKASATMSRDFDDIFGGEVFSQ